MNVLLDKSSGLSFWDYSFFLFMYEPNFPADKHMEEWQNFMRRKI